MKPSSPFRVSRAHLPRAAVGALALIALTLGACATVPDRGQVVMRDVELPLRDFRLPSGLRVVVEQDPRAPVVAIVALVGTGGSDDPSGKEGLAHVVEHLAFRARHGGSPSVWTRLEQLGAGRFNASTSLDETVYQTLAPREALPALLALEAQRLAAPIEGVTPEVFAVEREVIRNELRQRNETGYVGQALSWVYQATFPASHPYARPLIGTHESLTALTLTDAQRFARQHYRPENVTLVISGDVDLAAMDTLLQQSLPPAWHGTGLPLAPDARLAKVAAEPPPAPVAKALPVYEAAVAAPELYLAWSLPRGYDEASAVHEFVSEVLTPNLWGAMRSDGDIAGIDTALFPGTRASVLLVRVVLNKGAHPERSAERVLDQVHKTWAQRIHPTDVLERQREFQKMGRTVVTGMLLESEDLLARAERRAELTHFLLDVRAYDRAQEALRSVDGAKVTDFAYRWLQRDRARAILVKPGENGVPALPAAVPLLPDETAPTGASAKPSLAALAAPVHSLKLDNGVEVLLAPRPGLPVVRVGVALPGGEASGPRGVSTLAYLGAFPETHFEGEPGDWGLRVGHSLQQDNLRYEIAGTAGNVGNMLAVVGERLDSTRTTYDVVKFIQEQTLPWRGAVDARPEVVAQRRMMEALYGAHPYGHEATAEDMGRVKWETANDWLRQVHRPERAVVVIAGEFDMKQVEELARKYLGGWSGSGSPVDAPPVPPLPAATQPTLRLTPRPGATQDHLQVACRLPAPTPEAEARYAVMAELARARLWTQVREQRGASYGFFTGVTLARGGGAHLMVEGIVDAPKLADALDVVRKTLSTYAKDGVPEDELERARTRLVAREVVDFSNTRAWVNALLDARVLGFTPESVSQRAANLQAVTAASLQPEFAGCVDRLVLGVMGDEAQVLPVAKAAGL